MRIGKETCLRFSCSFSWRSHPTESDGTDSAVSRLYRPAVFVFVFCFLFFFFFFSLSLCLFLCLCLPVSHSLSLCVSLSVSLSLSLSWHVKMQELCLSSPTLFPLLSHSPPSLSLSPSRHVKIKDLSPPAPSTERGCWPIRLYASVSVSICSPIIPL